MQNLDWVKCGERGERFCPLETVDLDKQWDDGVYIIWHNTSGFVIYVGQGNIKERLTAHRTTPEILAQRGNGLLLTTWAFVERPQTREYIERYLHRMLRPLVSTCLPGPELEVNLPK